MKISVAMCTYNGERFLQEQLDSLANQTRLPDELIVCDDNSTDGTLSILQAFASQAPFPVHITRNDENLGSTRNFVKAISLCNGDVIALSDQDDIWSSAKLARSAAMLEEDPASDAVFTDGELIDAASRTIRSSLWMSLGFTSELQSLVVAQDMFAILKKQYFITGATLMFRAELKDFFTEIPSVWVHDAWITWILAIHGRVIGIPEALIKYRLHGGNQVGVNAQSTGDLLKTRTAEHMIRLLTGEAQRLMLLRNSIAQSGTGRSAEALSTIDRRLAYLRTRTAIVLRNRATRPLFAIAALRQYMEFGKGLRSLLGDLAL